MKTSIKQFCLTIMAVIMLFTGQLMAESGPEKPLVPNPNFRAEVFKGALPNTFRMAIASPDSVVKLTVYNANKQPVYFEKIKNASRFSRQYDFSQLPVGTYTVQFRKGDVRVSRVIKVEGK